MQKDYNRLVEFFKMGHLPIILGPGQVKIKIVHSVFYVENEEGDFAWMIKKPDYAKSLFIFNDNQEQFLEFVDNKDPGFEGGGNANIRPYQGDSPPRAMGIPTGTLTPYKGYQELDDNAKKNIDRSIRRLKKLLLSGNYNQVIISGDKVNKKTLGTGIFEVNEDVKDYIVQQVREAVKLANAKK